MHLRGVATPMISADKPYYHHHHTYDGVGLTLLVRCFSNMPVSSDRYI